MDGAASRDGERHGPAGAQCCCSMPGSSRHASPLPASIQAMPSPWIAELRRSNSVTFPGTAADSLAEALARAGVKPERLPERLQYEVRATTPQPSVTLARTGARYADGYRDTLGAVLRFDYAGTSVEPGGGVGVYDAVNRRLIRRDLAAEQRAFHRLRQLGFQQGWDYSNSKPTLEHPSRSLPARRAGARDRRMAGGGGRAAVPRASRHADARVVRRGLVRAARAGRFRRRRECEPAGPAGGAASGRGDGAARRRDTRAGPRGVAETLCRSRAIRAGGGGSRSLPAIADGAARRASREPAGDCRRRSVRPGA